MAKVYEKEGLEFITFENKDMEVTFCNLGAAIYSIVINGKYMTLTPKNEEDFLNNKIFHGKTIGRTSNRIKGNVVKISNKNFELKNNEEENVLHGGKEGLSTKKWEYEYHENEITFSYMSKDGESGYPGNLFIRVKYTLDLEEKSIDVDYSAQSDEKTLCSLTNHTFFSLGEDEIDNLQLLIAGKQYIFPDPTDLVGIRKDEVPPYLDFSSPKFIKDDINNASLQNAKTKGYDHYIFFDEINEGNQIILSGEKYQLTIKTDFEGVQIYSDNYEDEFRFFGTQNNMHRGIAIEPSDNHLELHYLEPNTAYQRHIKYQFFEKLN